jgi:hypothetical protein
MESPVERRCNMIVRNLQIPCARGAKTAKGTRRRRAGISPAVPGAAYRASGFRSRMKFHAPEVTTTMKHFRTRHSAKYHSDPSNLKLIMWAAIISIALILVSIALGIGIDSEVATFASP